MRKLLCGLFLALYTLPGAQAQEALLIHPYARPHQLLNGDWHYIIDPYDTGYRNHRNWTPFDALPSTKASAKPYYTNSKPQQASDRVEYDFDSAPTLRVPGDWNHQDPRLEYYEGSLWYKTSFRANPNHPGRQLLYFGAANYRADVYLNGQKVGYHEGGFTPFAFDVTELLEAENFLIVRVDNRREADRVPNLTTDWWNYGGITRDVLLVQVPETYISDYHIRLDPEASGDILVEVQLSVNTPGAELRIEVPELGLSANGRSDTQGACSFRLKAKKLKLWYPERPKLYEVRISQDSESITDRVGFRSISTDGENILLNGQSIFLRGISLHEENPLKRGRVSTTAETEMLFSWAHELNCNFIRLAHYPHSEYAARLADEMGFLLWEEIPVYWGLDYSNDGTLANAQNQLRELILRDRNRASVIVWSLANETPVNQARYDFLNALRATALELDSNRLISAALEHSETEEGQRITGRISDPFAAQVDLVSCNEYIGWYGSTPEACARTNWEVGEHDKPFFISEFGGGARYNLRGDSLTRWTEDYMAYLYREQIAMLRQIPSLRGMTPWILLDFRSPRRNLPGIQDGWNRKGVISDGGHKKMAFYILKAYYDEMERAYPIKIKD